MKIINCFIALYLLSTRILFGQGDPTKISGLWQGDQAKVTSMYLDTYQFFENGKFVFKPDAYNGLNRILSIGGGFKVAGDSLILIPEYTEELTGGYPVRSETTTLADTWEIKNGVIKKTLCKKRIKQTIQLKLCEKGNCILIDNRRFFKIEH
jgi:hypothetical protein